MKALIGSLVGATVLYLVGPIEVSITPTWVTIRVENNEAEMQTAPPLVLRGAVGRCMNQ